jgi:hypothetical protein
MNTIYLLITIIAREQFFLIYTLLYLSTLHNSFNKFFIFDKLGIVDIVGSINWF